MLFRDRPEIHDFEETAGFRATVLYLFQPEHVETVRGFGRLLYHLILAGDPYYPDEESQVRRELEAVRADLLHLQRFLAFIAAKPGEFVLEKPDLRLCRFASKLDHTLDQMLQDFDEELNRERLQ
jgi:hypothetical protein